jgi:hypothetical protein
MYQPEQKIHPLDREENERTSSSSIGEKTSSLGENLSGVTLGDSSEEKITETRIGEQKRTEGLPSKEESTIRCLADFAVYPLGTTVPFQKHIDEVEKVLKRCGMLLLLFFLARLFFMIVVACFCSTSPVCCRTTFY